MAQPDALRRPDASWRPPLLKAHARAATTDCTVCRHSLIQIDHGTRSNVSCPDRENHRRRQSVSHKSLSVQAAAPEAHEHSNTNANTAQAMTKAVAARTNRVSLVSFISVRWARVVPFREAARTSRIHSPRHARLRNCAHDSHVVSSDVLKDEAAPVDNAVRTRSSPKASLPPVSLHSWPASGRPVAATGQPVRCAGQLLQGFARPRA
jgi:hypothetical protein